MWWTSKTIHTMISPLKSVIVPRPLGKQVEHGPTVSHEYFTIFDRILYWFFGKTHSVSMETVIWMSHFIWWLSEKIQYLLN
jgi:hypothetical protein